MAQIDDKAFTRLLETIDQITRRVNRLNNWLELEDQLNRMTASFERNQR